MNCGAARRLFSSYWDDEVTQAERESLERHFAACGSCRAAYEELARTLEVVASLPRAEAPADFEQRVLAAVRRTAPAPDLLPVQRPRWVAAAAATAMLGMAVLIGYQWGSAPRGLPGSRVAREVAAPRPAPALPPAAATETGTAAFAGAAADSIFDHSADVELVLDPVVLYKGRPRTLPSALPPNTSAEQVVITF